MPLVALLTLLIPVAYLGFGRTDEPNGQPCSKPHGRLDKMDASGSLQWANEVGARASAPARLRTV